MTNLKKHFFNKKDFYIASAIIIFIYLIVLAIFSAFPFGKNSVAHYDMYHQVAPFVDLMFDIFEGKSSLSFSNLIGAGANTFGYLAYLIFNPFYLIILIFGRANTYLSINFVLLFQVLTVGLTFLWFSKKYFKLSTLTSVALSVAYAFNGFVLFNYTWLPWVNMSILMPIFVHQFIRLIKTGKILGLSLTIIAFILTCYGTGLFSQVLLFMLIFIFVHLMLPKEKRKTVLTKVILAYVVAIGVTSFVLVLGILQVQEGSRMISLMYNLLNGGLTNIQYGLNYLIVDFVLLGFNVFYIIVCDKKKKFNQFLMWTLLILSSYILINGINKVLNFGSLLGYNMRLGFLNTFFMFIVAIMAIKNIKRDNFVKAKAQLKPKNKYITIGILLIGIALFCALLIGNFDILSTFYSNASVSFGILCLGLAIVLVLIVALAYALVFVKNGTISKKFFQTFILIMLSVQVVGNAFAFTGKGFTDVSNLNFLHQQQVELQDDYARLKDCSNEIGANNHIFAGFGSVSAFTSSMNKNNYEIGEYFGYHHTINMLSSYGGSLLSDSFLGYKYFYSGIELDRPYLNLVSKQENGEKTYYLYQNMLALNSAIVVDSNKTLEKGDSYGATIQNLFNYLGGEGECVETLSITDLIRNGSASVQDIAVSVVNGVTVLEKKGDDAKIIVNMASSETEKLLYLDLNINLSNQVIVSVGLNSFPVHNECIYDVGFISQNQGAVMDINLTKTIRASEFNIYQVDYSKIYNLLTELQQQNINFNYTKSGYECTLIVSN